MIEFLQQKFNILSTVTNKVSVKGGIEREWCMLSKGSSVKGSPEDKQASALCFGGSAKISRRVTLALYTGDFCIVYSKNYQFGFVLYFSAILDNYCCTLQLTSHQIDCLLMLSNIYFDCWDVIADRKYMNASKRMHQNLGSSD